MGWGDGDGHGSGVAGRDVVRVKGGTITAPGDGEETPFRSWFCGRKGDDCGFGNKAGNRTAIGNGEGAAFGEGPFGSTEGSMLEVGLRIVSRPSGSWEPTRRRAQGPSCLIRSPGHLPGQPLTGLRSGGCSAPPYRDRPRPRTPAQRSRPSGEPRSLPFYTHLADSSRDPARHGA